MKNQFFSEKRIIFSRKIGFSQMPYHLHKDYWPAPWSCNKFIIQKPGDFFYNQIVIGADQLHRTGINCLRSFGGVAHHQHGFAESGGFLLNATAVGEHQCALLHQEDKRKIHVRLILPNFQLFNSVQHLFIKQIPPI